MTCEVWRDAVGFPGYQVSSHGRVMSYRQTKPKVLAASKTTNGYVKFRLVSPNGIRTVMAHKLVAEAFIGPRPSDKPHIRHLDGNRENNSTENITYGSVRENQLDSIEHGTHYSSKLSYAKAAKIRSLYQSGGHSYRSLAKNFEVHHRTIAKIVLGECWVQGGDDR